MGNAKRIAGQILGMDVTEEPQDISEGDFVNLKTHFGDVCHEVKMSFDDAVTIYNETSPRGKKYIHKDRISKVHRADEPWADHTARIVCTKDGDFGRTKHGPVRPLPEKFGEPSK